MTNDSSYRDVFGCPKVRVDQLSLLTQVGLRAFGEAGPLRYGVTRRQYYQRLHSINRNISRFVLLDANAEVTESNIVGIVVVMPTRKAVYDAFVAGELSQFQFGRDEVLPHDHADPCDVYVQTLYLDLPRQRLMRRLLKGLMQSLFELSRGGIDGHGRGGGVRIYAESVTDAGRQIMKAFDMRACGRSRDRNPTYAIHTYPGNPLVISTSRKLLNAEMQGYVTPDLVERPQTRDTEPSPA